MEQKNISQSSVWDKFPPFLREYIFSLGWKELYDIQEESARIILGTDNNLLLSCGTASGKTEAVFFPMLADICKASPDNIPHGTQILYIAPLKALINDQFDRISAICKQANITVHHRHGEVSAAEKERYFRSPSVILQITPESLEALLMRHPYEVATALARLKYIVVDELHAVMGMDRGNQIRCLIGRIMALAGVTPRIFALSATIGDTEGTCRWISACNNKHTDCPRSRSFGSLKASLFFEAFENPEDFNHFVYDAVRKKNSLVFSNSRDDTERITFALRSIASERGDRDDIYIHHGNISTSLRRDAERALKDTSRHSVVCATSTLELGIDIGRLERVVSIGSPNTVSGFLQRLGRSGRRDNTPEMLSVFIIDDESHSNELLPWEFLQGIAIVELYRREKFIEPPEEKKYPYSLLCHQTLSILAQTPVGMTPPELARFVLSLAPFRQIEPEDYRDLLKNLIANGYVEMVDGRKLILGLSGERLISSYHFLAVFKDEETYSVRDDGAGGKEIGILPEAVMPGGKFSLAGRAWICEKLDAESKIIHARLVGGKITSCWKGNMAGIDDKIAQYVSLILTEDEIYPYLGKNAISLLTRARLKAKSLGLPQKKLIYMRDESFIFVPFLGSTSMATMRRYISYACGSMLLSAVTQDEPYVLSFKMREADATLFTEYLTRYIYSDEQRTVLTDCANLMNDHEHYLSEKFDSLVPPHLLKKAFANDRLNLSHIAACLEEHTSSGK